MHHFVLASDAFVVVPYGIVSVLELSTIWQLLQVRKLRKDTPLILIGEMWADFVAWARNNLLRPEFELAGAEEIRIPRCVQTAEEAVALIKPHYDDWLRKSPT